MKYLSKKAIVLLILAGMLTTLLTGCGSEHESTKLSIDMGVDPGAENNYEVDFEGIIDRIDEAVGVGGYGADTNGEKGAEAEAPVEEAPADAEAVGADAEAEGAEAEAPADAEADGADAEAADEYAEDWYEDAGVGTAEGEDEDIAEPIEEEDDGEDYVNASMLTASVWNDLDNWGFFTNIVNSELISFPSYGLDPTHLVTVHITDNSGEAVANANVTLLSGGNEIYKAVSDKNGYARLFETEEAVGDQVAISVNGISTTVAVGSHVIGGETQGEQKASGADVDAVVDTKTVNKSNTQVMFILDTTGSMSDEMLYLQSDFASIAREVGKGSNVSYCVNLYKDAGEEYVTQINDFTSNTKDISNILKDVYASGGGDAPEAVGEALDESFNSAGWNEDSVKVAFLIFDAPPHYEDEQKIRNAVAVAAEKGIHVIPVVSSNSDRDTEVFGRALAIMTNGQYVFLTDDSGIGNSHLEPIIGDHEVEKLHDIIVRIINNYKQS